MDSVTQFVLGASIGVATLGRRLSPRKAAVMGGLLATLPDLDVLLPTSDAIDAFVGHRGPTHSLFVHTLLTPLIGEAIRRFDGRLSGRRWQCWLFVWLTLTTHALLDAFTTYGTRLWWPFSDYAVSWSSIFIIDPLYTLPLLAATFIAFGNRAWTGRVSRATGWGLALSSLYLGWSLIAQQIAESKVRQALDAAGLQVDRLMMIPMPFTTLLWRGLAINVDQHINVYRSVFDREPAAPVHRHDRGAALERLAGPNGDVGRVANFTHGFHALRLQGDQVLLEDIRLGVHPSYVFTFRIGRLKEQRFEPEPVSRLVQPRDFSGAGWLFRRIWDERAERRE